MKFELNKFNIKFIFYFSFTFEFIFSSPGLSSFESMGVGAYYQGMGGTCAGYAHTSDAIFLNCSGLSQLSDLQLSFYYANLFGLKELTHGSLSAHVPFGFGHLGAGWKTFGDPLYRENELILSFASGIQKRFYYGFSLRYMNLAISKYGSDSALGVDFGFIARMNSRVNVGFYTHHFNRPRISARKETIPPVFCTGVSIRPVENASIHFDLFKDVEFPLELRFGFEYLIVRNLALRSGFITEVNQFTAGFGILFPFIRIDYAIQTHGDLGNTHQFSLIISMKR